ncbi:hypothetical protein BT69DRAFT_87480 [Atractiella rhizophila]|nr:hypothetical protein BT69DRAFT_87480 [Atractiella rhizophila]
MPGGRRAKLEKTQACRLDAQRRSVELDKWATVDNILSKDDQGTYLISADAPYLHFRASLFEEAEAIFTDRSNVPVLHRFCNSVLRHVGNQKISELQS